MIHESTSSFLTAEEAAERLGISRSTLYAYVSRGMIRSEPEPGTRRRRYARDDVERLVERQAQRRDPERVAERSLDWGTPVVESAITRIDEGRLFYRGHDVAELARQRSVEEVAALVWAGEFTAAERLFGREGGASAAARRAEPDLDHVPPLERCQALLPLAAAADAAAWDLRPSAVAATGARILALVAGWCAHRGTAGPADPDAVRGVAATLAAGWGLADRPEAVRAVSAALVLSADHELNVSTFTARCVASAGSTPYDAVAAGLAALKGTRHGGVTGRVEALLREAGSPDAARRTVAGRLRRGEEIPGFGHRLYPQGDPRARALMDLAAELAGVAGAGTARPAGPVRSAAAAPDLDLVLAVARAAEDLLGEPPSLDLGLVAVARALALPDGAALTLFAAGRTIGWLGHAIEEYARGRLIRPRARYVGE